MKMFTLLFFHFFHQMLKLYAEFREDENEVRTPRNRGGVLEVVLDLEDVLEDTF